MKFEEIAMEIKTTRDLGVWFANIRECQNDVVMSNPINLNYLHKSWVSVDSILKELKSLEPVSGSDVDFPLIYELICHLKNYESKDFSLNKD